MEENGWWMSLEAARDLDWLRAESRARQRLAEDGAALRLRVWRARLLRAIKKKSARKSGFDKRAEFSRL